MGLLHSQGIELPFNLEDSSDLDVTISLGTPVAIITQVIFHGQEALLELTLASNSQK